MKTLLIAVLAVAGAARASEWEEDDMVIVEAEENVANFRTSRQLNYPLFNPFMPARGLPHSCYTSEGYSGLCVTRKQCNPFYNLPYDLPDWALGEKDTCAAQDALGRTSVYGVCCATRQFGFPGVPGFGSYPVQGAPQYPSVPQAPAYPPRADVMPALPTVPPGHFDIPTHPPGHNVIPPLPTHPPSHGQYPVQPAPLPSPVHPVPIPAPVQPAPIHPAPVHPTPVHPAPVHPAPVQPAPAPLPAPAPVQPAPAPVQPVPQQPAPAVPDSPVIDSDGDDAVAGGSGLGACGVGRAYPIRYGDNRVDDEEALRRISGEHPLRVVNGWPADKNEWPWIAALLNNGRQFCGGSLIDDRHILTAAHCVAHMTPQNVAALTVRLGDHDIKSTTETRTFETKVSRVVRHKGFSDKTLHNDVALITLSQAVPSSYKDVIRPVCLPSGNDRYAKRMGTVVGWGSLRENGPQPAILQELTMEIWDNQKCKTTYGRQAPGGITEHMLCAGQKGKDSCSGDSGGPMVVGNGATWEQVGVVSWGIGCGKAHFPGVYTRTTNMRPWIQKVQRKF